MIAFESLTSIFILGLIVCSACWCFIGINIERERSGRRYRRDIASVREKVWGRSV